MHQPLSTKKAKWFAICFILTFLSYGIGQALVSDLFNVQASISELIELRAELLTALFLISIVHTISSASLPLLTYRFFNQYNRILSKGYLALGVISSLILAGNAYPIYQLWLELSDVTSLGELREIQTAANIVFSNLYALSMTIWGLAGICFARLLGESKLLPAYLSTLAIVFYSIFFTHSILSVLQVSAPKLLVAPTVFLEVTLSVYFLFLYKSQNSMNRLSNTI